MHSYILTHFDLEEITFEISGFSEEGIMISAYAITHCILVVNDRVDISDVIDYSIEKVKSILTYKCI